MLEDLSPLRWSSCQTADVHDDDAVIPNGYVRLKNNAAGLQLSIRGEFSADITCVRTATCHLPDSISLRLTSLSRSDDTSTLFNVTILDLNYLRCQIRTYIDEHRAVDIASNTVMPLLLIKNGLQL